MDSNDSPSSATAFASQLSTPSLSHISTAGYDTFTDTTPTGTTTTSSVTPHPWREFLDRSTLSCPYFYDDAMIQV
ncbi:hypothetical protein JHK84_055453 [Glycine max]|nr:hypothetical protein JHK86_055412 [Glycine max]KAG4909562.1 hypothetical protein JHK87_055678 [Glycine soja]KAG4918146.1 hypothetical protein JHK85_056427 [Glycine max]KAG5074222.1 hypothetical protein JHK84_055453 [Glycine max]